MYSELYYRLAFNRMEHYGVATKKKMLRFAGSATAVFNNPESWKMKLSNRSKKVAEPTLKLDLKREVEKELNIMEKHGIKLCHYLDSDYPYRMKLCSDSPVCFYYKGASIFNQPQFLAIVGTRSASEYGRNCVKKILTELRDTQIVTVSGLAYGIDTEAHQRSLENGLRTIAVLGSGLGNVYPATNQRLAQQIVENGGVLLSEFPYDTIPDRLNFPRRNRIIAGMSDAVLVAETADKGGSMITAYIANSYNRDIFAIPGSIFSERYQGCHELIRKNMAAIVTSGGQLMEMMNWERQAASVQTSLFVDITEEEQHVVDLLRAGKVHLDALTEALEGFSPSKIAGLLLGLELKGVIVCKPGKVYGLA